MQIEEEQLTFLIERGFRINDIAALFGCCRTVERCLNEFHLSALSVVKAWVGLTAAKIARAVRVCTRHRMLCNCGLLNTATLMITV